MLDGEGDGGTGGTEGGEGGEGGGEGGGAQAPEWMGTLPDDLKGDATLSRYADVSALAKAHIEAHKVAKSKVVIPGEGATDEDWGKFYNAIGRPETADGYTDIPSVELPVDATDEERAARDGALKPYRELAHRIGLTPAQAKELAQFDLDRSAAALTRSNEEVAELETKLGKDYEPKRAAAQQIFTQLFGEGMDAALLANEFDKAIGNSARFLKGMMRLAEVAGEHKIIDSDKVEGFGDVKDASGKLDELMADAEWRKRFNANDPATVRQHRNLLETAQRQAMRGRG
jgi:hypothetical protein